jgi:hypothetical protein
MEIETTEEEIKKNVRIRKEDNPYYGENGEDKDGELA